MKTKHKVILEEAIDKALSAISEEDMFPAWFYAGLVEQMTAVAVCLFDASMDAQIYCREQDED